MKGRAIILNETYDVDIKPKRNSEGKIIRGLIIGNTTYQNAGLIVKAQPGEFKGDPLIGVGIDNMLLSHEALRYKHLIREQLTLEGIDIKSLNITDKEIELQVSY